MKSSFKVWETNGKSKFQRWKLNPIILNQVETLQSSNKLAFLPVFPIHPTNILKYNLKHSILYLNLLHIFNNVGTWKKLEVLLFFVFVGSWRGLSMYNLYSYLWLYLYFFHCWLFASAANVQFVFVFLLFAHGEAFQ